MPLTKPPVLPAWAEAGDKVQPSNAEIQAGWPLSNVPPSRQRFNWLLNFLANGIRYLTRRGLPDWGADETYEIGDRVIGDDGKTYRSIQDNNTGNAPSASPLWWERWGFGASELSTELNKLDYKASCRVATTANLAALSGLLTIDGVVLVAGDRVLVKDQTTPSQNGIYTAAAGAWSRATDFDENSEVTAGALVIVEAGTTQADSLWMLTTDNPITVGTTPLSIIRKDYQQPQSQSHFSTVINGDCHVATKAPPAISTSGQYGKVDMFAAWATGTAVSAGTITQDTASPIGDAGTALHLSGVTVTGSGVVYTQYRQKGEDSKSFKNKKASFGVLVHHDVGSSINYTITIKKATALDNFGATTTIATSSAQSVPTGTGTLVKFENVDMGDCSNGWSMEVSAACGAVTTKNFRFTEFRAVRGGSLPTDMLPRLLSDDRAACREFCRMINPFTAGSGDIFHAGRALTTSTFRGVFRLDPPMRVAPAVTVVGTNSNFAGEYGNGSIVSATATPTLFSSDRNAVEINFACAANLTAQTPVTVKAAGNAQILLESQL